MSPRFSHRPAAWVAAWITLFLCLAIDLAGLWALALSPDFAARFRADHGAVILTQVSSNSAWTRAGIHSGARLVAVAGRAVDPVAFIDEPEDSLTLRDREAFWEWQRFLWSAAQAPNITFTVEQDGIRRELAVPVQSLGLLQALGRSLPTRLAGWTFLIVPFLLWTRKAGETALASFAGGVGLFCCFATMVYACRDACLPPDAFAALAAMNFVFGCSALICLHLAFVFPTPVEWFPRYSWVRALPWILASGMIALRFSGAVFVPPSVSYILWGGAPLAFMATIVLRLWRCRDPLLRQQLRWVALGAIGGFLPWVLLSALPRALNLASIPDTLSLLFAMATPICLSFAVFRYRLLDVDRVFHWVLAHTAILGAFSLLELAFWTWLNSRSVSNALRPTLITLSMFVLVFLYAPLRGWLLDKLTRLSGRAHPPVAECLAVLLQRASLSADAFLALGHTIDFALHPQRLVWIHEGEGYDELLRRLKPLTAGVPGYELGEICPKDMESVAWLPLNADRGTVALLLWPTATRGWNRQDLKLAATLIRASEPLFEIHAMQREHRYSQELVRQEREELLREMHDGLGSHLFGASLLASVTGSESEALLKKRMSAVSSALVDAMESLRTGLTVLGSQPGAFGPAVLSMLLRSEDILQAAGIALAIDVDDNATCLYLEGRQIFGILRAMQTGLTNVALHSRATKARVGIHLVDGTLTIRIEDDGVGFDFQRQHPGHGLANMMQRLKSLGGTTRIMTAPGQGCILEFEVPALHERAR